MATTTMEGTAMDTRRNTPTDASSQRTVLTAWLGGLGAGLVWTAVTVLLTLGAAYAWLAGATRAHVAETQGPWSFPAVYVTIDPSPAPLVVAAVVIWGLGLVLIACLGRRFLLHRG